MAHREVFVLADVGGEHYQDYLNFSGNGHGDDEPSSMAYQDETQPIAKSRARISKKSRPAAPRDLYDDMQQAQTEMHHHSITGEQTSRSAKPSAGEYNEPANKKIPPKQVAEHQSLMMILQRYAASERFAPKIAAAGVKLTNLESKSVAQLKELQTRVRTVCSSTAGTNGMLGTGILMGCAAVEAAAPKRIVDLTGFQASVGNDPEYAALCEQIELDMGFMSTMSPTLRLTMCLGKHAAVIANQNVARNALLARLIAQQQQQQPIGQQAAQEQAPVMFSESMPVSLSPNQPEINRAGCIPSNGD
jgi:hypothetical protein